jgi:hypothetical protein
MALMKLSHKERSHSVSPLDKNIQSATLQFAADFLKSDSFKHGSTKGAERESPVQGFLRHRLPSAFRIDKGEVVDLLGNTSPQADALVSDGVRNFPLVDGDSVILPAEALLVVVEVKSLLNRSEVEKILKAAKRFKDLRPFKQPIVARRRRGDKAADGSRIFYTVFAYQTDLAEQDWAKREHERFREVAAAFALPLHAVDRVYVANRGLLDVGGERGFEENGTTGSGLLQFYMHMLGFLLRENGRRDPAPYLEYAGRMVGGWKSFRTKVKREAANHIASILKPQDSKRAREIRVQTDRSQ